MQPVCESVDSVLFNTVRQLDVSLCDQQDNKGA